MLNIEALSSLDRFNMFFVKRKTTELLLVVKLTVKFLLSILSLVA